MKKEYSLFSEADKSFELYLPGDPEISDEGEKLLERHGEVIQGVINSVYEDLDTLNKNQIIHLLEEQGCHYIDSGSAGIVFSIPLPGEEDDVVLKVYYEDLGLIEFEDNLKAQKCSDFDSVIPYAASERYQLMSKIPEEYQAVWEFLQENPDLRSEVIKALASVQVVNGLTMDNGVDINDFLEGRIPDTYSPANVYLAHYNPAGKTLAEKYRFYFIDIGFDVEEGYGIPFGDDEEY